MKILDEQNQETTFMNESFGWKGNEVLQQHDIQEAMKIVFDLIERALFGTHQYDAFIKNLRGKEPFFICNYRQIIKFYKMLEM